MNYLLTHRATRVNLENTVELNTKRSMCCMAPPRTSSRTSKTNPTWQRSEQWMPTGRGWLKGSTRELSRVFYILVWAGGRVVVHICENSLNFTVKIYAFYYAIFTSVFLNERNCSLLSIHTDKFYAVLYFWNIPPQTNHIQQTAGCPPPPAESAPHRTADFSSHTPSSVLPARRAQQGKRRHGCCSWKQRASPPFSLPSLLLVKGCGSSHPRVWPADAERKAEGARLQWPSCQQTQCHCSSARASPPEKPAASD